jgi:hypothetical protein
LPAHARGAHFGARIEASNLGRLSDHTMGGPMADAQHLLGRLAR